MNILHETIILDNQDKSFFFWMPYYYLLYYLIDTFFENL